MGHHQWKKSGGQYVSPAGSDFYWFHCERCGHFVDSRHVMPTGFDLEQNHCPEDCNEAIIMEVTRS